VNNIKLELRINEEHILAARRNRRGLTPIEMAVLQQTDYLPTGFIDGSISLIDEDGKDYLCHIPPEMSEFLQAFRADLPVSPATFELECAAN
jgi:hypothetical protein